MSTHASANRSLHILSIQFQQLEIETLHCGSKTSSSDIPNLRIANLMENSKG